jgi:RecB family exonuclease
MTIVFGLALDQSFFPFPDRTQLGTLYLGPTNLLNTLENYFGLSGHRNDTEYLRVEQYRQVITQHLRQFPDSFYVPSFEANQFSTAQDLLSRRDELLVSGFDFSRGDMFLPERLKVLSELEQSLQSSNQLQLHPGRADRMVALMKVMSDRAIPIKTLHCIEPKHSLPIEIKRLFAELEKVGVRLQYNTVVKYSGDSDLQYFQQLLYGQLAAKKINGDGSLLIIKAKRDTDLATFTAGLVRKNEKFRPALVLSGAAQVLDNAFVQEGLPSLGIRATSLSRPPLQLLKLATSFLWAPLDPYHLLEFVSLPLQPLDSELAYRIAIQIASAPGVDSTAWRSMIAQYFNQLDERASADDLEKEKIKQQYRFWFERKRYSIHEEAPKIEAIQIFAFLEQWAKEEVQDLSGQYVPLLTLSEKARQIKELLEELPEHQMSRLELERVVRTIYEPAPLLFNEKQKDALPVVLQPHALYGSTDQCLWWNFVEQEPDYFFSRWYQSELEYLKLQSIALESPTDKNQRLIWQRQQPILWTKDQLLLLVPEVVEGKSVQAHPLQGYLEAGFTNLNEIIFDIDIPQDRNRLQAFFELPQAVDLVHQQLGKVKPIIQIKDRIPLERREYETFTSLENLLYYPYQWVFKYLLKLRKSPILSIVRESTLMGNLAHRLLEYLLGEPRAFTWSREEVYRWIEQRTNELLHREGAVLLLYGKEPLRIGFVKKMQMAGWSLLDSLKNNGWEVVALEQDLEGQFAGASLKARADLIIKRENEYAILDLKWRGATRRKTSIKNQEDLQLILYAFLHQPTSKWAHTAYYIIERAELIARNNSAFQEATSVAPELDMIQTYEMILERMQATYHWRLAQIEQGEVEVRCEQTAAVLDETYGDMLDFLEMKKQDAPFDDYKVLINLLN